MTVPFGRSFWTVPLLMGKHFSISSVGRLQILFFFKDNEVRFYKLASTNCHTNVTSTASDFLRGFLRSDKQKEVGSSLALDQKLFVHVILALRFFFANFFNDPKGSPFNFFLFSKRMDVQKIVKAPLFTFFGTMRLTGDFKKVSETFFLIRVL